MDGDDEDFDEDELVQLSFLRDEETDALVSAGILGDHVRLTSPLDDEVAFTFDELILAIRTGRSYPIRSPVYNITNISLPRQVVDDLRHRLKDIASSAEAMNNLESWRARDNNAFGIFEPVMVVLQLAKATTAHLNAYRSGSQVEDSSTDSGPDKTLWFLSPDAKKAVTIHNSAVSTSELAYSLLRATPGQIASEVGGHFRVLHIEQVLRADHARSITSFQTDLRRRLSKVSPGNLRRFLPPHLRTPRTADMIDHLTKTHTTFHGTKRQFVPSIVRHGFLVPGVQNPTSGEEQLVRCGSTYGRGIYSSPSANFSLSYTGQSCQRTSPSEFFGIKLLVCATVMGRSRAMYRSDNWQGNAEAYEGVESHIGNNGLEYIVFDSAQIVPVYVIHLDWGADNAQYFEDLPDDPRKWAAKLSERRGRADNQGEMGPGDRKRAREAVHAKASKYFPYGYGPATGAKFVVEEVGEVSDDEEDYGDYQQLRANQVEDGITGNFWSWVKAAEAEEDTLLEGTHNADEYNWERKVTGLPQGFRSTATEWDKIELPGKEKTEIGEEDEDGFFLDSLTRELPEDTSS